jgi:hypothetical protein
MVEQTGTQEEELPGFCKVNMCLKAIQNGTEIVIR